MVSPGLTAIPEWKQFLLLGEELLKQPNAAAQCNLIGATLKRLLGAQAVIWLTATNYPLPNEPEVLLLPSPDAPAFVQQVFESHQPTCRAREDQACSSDHLPCSLAFPILTQENLLGVLEVHRDPNSPFRKEEIDFLEGLVAHAASYLQIFRQASLKNWRSDQLTLVRSVSAQIANVTDLTELSKRVTRLIQQTFKYYYVAIFTLDQNGEILQFRASASQSKEDRQTTLSARLGEGVIGYSAQIGKEYYVPDVHNDPHYRFVDSLPETESEVSFPLKIEQRVLGVLDVQSDQVDAFHELDRIVLRALANNVAIAVEGARLYSDVQRRAEQISAVFDITHALTSILDLDKLLDTVVETIQKRFGYPFVHLYSVHPGRRLILYWAGSGARSGKLREQQLQISIDDPKGIIPWVARTGKPLLANDVRKEPLYKPYPLLPYETCSEVALPLTYGGETQAILDLQSTKYNAFDEKDISILEALSASIAIALRNASLYRSEQWRRQVADSFRDVANLLNADITLDELLNSILSELEKNLPCEASAIWLYEEDPQHSDTNTRLRLAYAHGFTLEHMTQVLKEDPTARQVLEATLPGTEPTIRRPTDPLGPLGAALGFKPNYSSIAAPLMAGQQPLGVLTLAHSTYGRYGSEARAMTATFASYASSAIQNARLYAAAQEQAWVSTVLLQVAEACQALNSVDDLLETMVRLTPLLVGIKNCAIFLIDSSRQAFILKSWYGIEGLAKGEVLFYESETPGFQKLLDTQSPVFIQDAKEELHLPEAALSGDNSTLVLVPLVTRQEIIGAMLVGHQNDDTPGFHQFFDQQTLAILQGIAHQTAVAVENIQLLEVRQEEAYVTAVLLQVAQAVVSQNNLTDILDTIGHLMPILVGIDACIIYLWDNEHKRHEPAQAFTGQRQQEQQVMEILYAAGEFPLLDQVLKTDAPSSCPLPDPGLSPLEWHTLPCSKAGEMPTPAQSARSAWLLGFPLSVKGEVNGVMLTKESPITASFHEKRLEIISGIAQQVSLAIQNEHLNLEMVERERLEKEIQLARQIQQSFLPSQLPQLPGWDLDIRWQTARQVGGDFYDVFHLRHGKLGLVIADVSDKGLPAALYMTVTRTLIRAFMQNTSSPGRVLERVNNLLLMDSQNGMFVTAVYAALDPDRGILTCANAGHNRAWLWRAATNDLEQLPKGEIALGVLESVHYSDKNLEIFPGDCLLFFTDGLTECFSPTGETYGEDRLTNIILSTAARGVHDLLHAIEQSVIEFRDIESVSDDITLLAIQRHPETKS
ncbi:serine phosphatase RsbU, regulator of sigma subunit [Longilinea arvoryzae]|uniref:Serine phosphatase RsbU, regulator of sigma subunit n=1 Tax=Longilinea arvoryzae TaxID=360412 RepID=A0A0S7BKP2_9CHLR|nr:GAF domain-containing protein [Longilinea arvoryzae]GAP14385.1 serine phosphatase RsbU, regulator of sigma subunit [Longilinea arvoryzae]